MPLAIDLFCGLGGSFQSASVAEGFKSAGMDWSDRTKRGQNFTRIAGMQAMSGIKQGGDWFNASEPYIARKHASAMIAKIPLPLSRHIGAIYKA